MAQVHLGMVILCAHPADMITRLILVPALLSLAAPAMAQEAPRDFCAARPGKGSPTCILDQGRWQLELGLIDFSRQTDVSSRTTDWAAGDVLIRHGITPTTELQFGLTIFNRQSVVDRTTGDRVSDDGVGDLSLGVAHSLANPDGSGVSVAVGAYVTAPTGSRAFRADGFEGGIVAPVSLPLNADWTLSLSPGVDLVSDSDGQGRHAAYALAAGVGRGVGDWDLGVELWAQRDEDPITPTTQSTLDLTAVWSPPFLADAQLDFGLNFGLNDDSPDVEFGIGVARRF
jgi:hypothetical protein